MKKLLVVTAVLMLLTSAVGCGCCNWCFRGAPRPPMATYSEACPPVTTYMDSCAPAMPCGPCATPQTVVPGPAPYTAVPGPAPYTAVPGP